MPCDGDLQVVEPEAMSLSVSVFCFHRCMYIYSSANNSRIFVLLRLVNLISLCVCLCMCVCVEGGGGVCGWVASLLGGMCGW